jgi:3-hydroxy-3-methylglutaryl CoA synthase
VIGIVSFGAYIPRARLRRDLIRKGLRGETSLASFDEDAVTMAVEAVLNCLGGLNREEVDGLFFASTTSPYKEGMSAAIVATACDLRKDIITADFANSLRSGTSALALAAEIIKAGSAHKILVVATEYYRTAPGSDWEQDCGDGAAAFLVGDSNVIASLEAHYSIYSELMDVWRSQENSFIHSGEMRFITSQGYLPAITEAVTGLLKKHKLSEKDFAKVIISVPNERRQFELARSLGFNPKSQLQGSLLESIGDTGAAYAPILLISALPETKAGDLILACSYGNGSDALVLKVTEGIKGVRNKGVKEFLTYKKTVDDYKTYLEWRGLFPQQRIPYPLGEVSPVAVSREVDQNVRLYGVKCKVCGTIQFPPQRVCTRCHTKDQFEPIRLSDKKGILFTYSIDYSPAFSPQTPIPTVISVVNFEGGGRIQCFMTDFELDEVKVEMPVEMTFRKLNVRGGIHNYSWKCRPVRA